MPVRPLSGVHCFVPSRDRRMSHPGLGVNSDEHFQWVRGRYGSSYDLVSEQACRRSAQRLLQSRLYAVSASRDDLGDLGCSHAVP